MGDISLAAMRIFMPASCKTPDPEVDGKQKTPPKRGFAKN
jgi:hypothetical protein